MKIQKLLTVRMHSCSGAADATGPWPTVRYTRAWQILVLVRLHTRGYHPRSALSRTATLVLLH